MWHMNPWTKNVVELEQKNLPKYKLIKSDIVKLSDRTSINSDKKSSKTEMPTIQRKNIYPLDQMKPVWKKWNQLHRSSKSISVQFTIFYLHILVVSLKSIHP